MAYLGIVKNGVVVIEEGKILPEGMEVRIEPIVQAVNSPREGPTLAEQLGEIIGVVPELPPNMSEHHDRYLHGIPKQ